MVSILFCLRLHSGVRVRVRVPVVHVRRALRRGHVGGARRRRLLRQGKRRRCRYTTYY